MTGQHDTQTTELEALRAENKELRESLQAIIDDLAMRARMRGDDALDVSHGKLMKAQLALNPDEDLILKVDEATAIAQETGQYGEWRTHDSHEPPGDLAAAQLVDLLVFPESMRLRADRTGWYPGLQYRPALSANGLPLCSGEGLQPWARYVATDELHRLSGGVWQNNEKPEFSCKHLLWWHRGGEIAGAPETHRRPGPASESLMEVSRD